MIKHLKITIKNELGGIASEDLFSLKRIRRNFAQLHQAKFDLTFDNALKSIESIDDKNLIIELKLMPVVNLFKVLNPNDQFKEEFNQAILRGEKRYSIDIIANYNYSIEELTEQLSLHFNKKIGASKEDQIIQFTADRVDPVQFSCLATLTMSSPKWDTTIKRSGAGVSVTIQPFSKAK